jgi:PhzF family phenazine biosynthesis protein
MQQIAFENGFAETAFFVPLGLAGDEPRYQLRWFTPKTEVDLCGHATLAAGHVVLCELGAKADAVTFDSRSGPLRVSRAGERLELDFPATPVTEETDADIAATVRRALGVPVAWHGRSIFDRFAVLADETTVRTVKPDLGAVATAGGRGLIVTARGDSCDFVSRFFAPQVGVPEDPVTGSAHCALAVYWAERLGRPALHARQVSPRGGELWCEVVGMGDKTRVKIAGHASVYLRGEIVIDGTPVG